MARYEKKLVNGIDYIEFAVTQIDAGVDRNEVARLLWLRYDVPEVRCYGIAGDAKIGWVRDEYNKRNAQKSIANAPWQQHPATEAQYQYIQKLGGGRMSGLTKSQASAIIDSLKSNSGDGIGWTGKFYADGSN